MERLFKIILVVVFLISLVKCRKSESFISPPTSPPIADTVAQQITLEISFSLDTVFLDPWSDTATIVANVRDQNRNPITASLSWLSLNQEIVQVSENGVVKSIKQGSARIKVTAAHPNSQDNVTAEIVVKVLLQPNPKCQIPNHKQREVAVDQIFYGQAINLEHLPKPAYDGSRSIPVDFDGDGKVDIVRLEYSYPFSAQYLSSVSIFKGTGNGNFIDATNSSIKGSIIPDHPRDFEVADFTGDGILDIFVAQHGYDAPPFPGAPNLLLTLNDGRLENQFLSRFSPARSNGFSHGSSAGDVDCDGDLDIVEINVSNLAPNALFLNNGSGNFTSAEAGSFPLANQILWQEVAFIDFDSDGDPDIFLGARSGTGLNKDIILVNDGFGRFRERQGIQTPPGKFEPNRAINNAKAADFNGDGFQDLILFEIPEPFSSVSAIRLWINNGDGSFKDSSEEWGLPSQCTGEIIEPLWVRDLNGDGWPDVILPPNCFELNAGILINTGNRFSFSGFERIAPWHTFEVATPIDIDGSSKPALFFGERGASPILVPIR